MGDIGSTLERAGRARGPLVAQARHRPERDDEAGRGRPGSDGVPPDRARAERTLGPETGPARQVDQQWCPWPDCAYQAETIGYGRWWDECRSSLFRHLRETVSHLSSRRASYPVLRERVRFRSWPACSPCPPRAGSSARPPPSSRRSCPSASARPRRARGAWRWTPACHRQR